MTQGISAVLNTLNEERNLEFALRSVVTWVDEIVVVDMNSDDSTPKIAASFGARVISHPRLKFADPARPFAVAQATQPWVLMLDADELVPPDLSRLLLEIASKDIADVVIIPWVNMLLGAQIAHSGWGPTQDKHPRFFKKDSITLAPNIHDFIRPATGAKVLEIPWDNRHLGVVHFNYTNVSHFLRKLDAYTGIEAQQAGDSGRSLTHALMGAAGAFLKRLIWLRGLRDGWRGFFLSAAMGFYRITAWAKARELSEGLTETAVLNHYRCHAEALLSGYETRGAGPPKRTQPSE